LSALQKALSIIRERASNDTELGNAFERLSKVFLENDATQTQQYSQVWHYSDWAKEQEGYTTKDIGIDLVAKLRDEDGYCAIQCKFYQSNHTISKADLDSFISASASADFTRLILIDTSTQPIGKNAQSVFKNLTQEYIRIQLSELEESRIDWLSYINEGTVRLHSKKELRDHQIKALNAVREGLARDDRGKMIMACGTGKTFTSLRIAEDLAGVGKTVLYMVPSLALMSQTIREWKNDAKDDFIAFSACSDSKVGKKKASNDQIEVSLNDLAFPATTDGLKLSEQIKTADKSKMTVVFSTYHSIDVISKSQYHYELTDFDLIICDEAHRTTGATLVGDDESNFVKIHSNENVRGKKRLYMTATPKIFGETAKKKAEDGEVALASMDDENTFGKNFFYRSFGWAVDNNLLTDYKVVVLMMDEQLVSNRVQRSFTDGAELKLDDATKMVGCYKALAKIGISDKKDSSTKDTEPMKRALAFCQNIESSEIFSSKFSNVVEDYNSHEKVSEENKKDLKVELFHVDGTFNAEQRNEKLNWLKDEADKNTCRVLTNARCLSEGVDVPALDAIMFLHPRKSQIDVVQSVGRVMRKSEGKDLGYVILPITVAPGVSAEQALNDNERYKVVWQILNALRAHDERFDSTINQIGIGEDVSGRIEIIDGTSNSELEATTAVVEDVKPKTKKKEDDDKGTDTNLGSEYQREDEDGNGPEQLSFTLTDLSQAIKAKIVEKCGTRDYWENWATDIAKIAHNHITRINSIVLNSGTPERKAFMQFVEEIRDDLNPEISENDAVEMLAQHIITRPVFDTLFQGNRFTAQNAVSKAMETVLAQIYDRNIDTESRTLEKFYDSVRRRAADIVTSTGRQTLVLELYDRFFRNAFPLMTQKLGIVYTPVEVVDFIIHSVEDVMHEEFGSSLGSDGVHILDPFSGTGTFISRLLQSGVMSTDQIRRKFKTEIHANEIVLLAYYIACINIEAVYDDLVNDNQYQPFNGMVLTDTFQLYEQNKDMIARLLPDNSKRRTMQKNRNMKIIVGNPPYSVHARTVYPKLDKSYSEKIISRSNARQKSSLNDPFYKAIFWAATHLGEEGIVAFVVNNSWILSSIADEFRRFLSLSFSAIYLIDLKGDIRKARFDKDNLSEGENVFGNNSQNGIVIAIFVKKKGKELPTKIKYINLGDNLKTREKLNILQNFGSLKELSKKANVTKIIPNQFSDWLNPRRTISDKVFRLGDKSGSKNAIFLSYTSGVKTNRDQWAINFSRKVLIKNMKHLISSYNKIIKNEKDFKKLKFDSKNIKWDGTLEKAFEKKQLGQFKEEQIRRTSLRPFVDSYVYFSKQFNNSIYLNNLFFPIDHTNSAIGIPGLGSRSNFSPLVVKELPNYDFFDKTQFFPMYKFYSSNDIELEDGNFTSKHMLEKRSNINPSAVEEFRLKYKDNTLSHEDLFFYTYALLNSSQYIEYFKTILGREMPPIPFVNLDNSIRDFCGIGHKLFDLHTRSKDVSEFKEKELFERTIDISPSQDITKNVKIIKNGQFYELRYLKHALITQIPENVLSLKYNGKSPLEWAVLRFKTREYVDSGNKDDINIMFAEDEQNSIEAYLSCLKKIITITIKTIELVKSLDQFHLEFIDENAH
jgi:predicted helicase